MLIIQNCLLGFFFFTKFFSLFLSSSVAFLFIDVFFFFLVSSPLLILPDAVAPFVCYSTRWYCMTTQCVQDKNANHSYIENSFFQNDCINGMGRSEDCFMYLRGYTLYNDYNSNTRRSCMYGYRLRDVDQ